MTAIATRDAGVRFGFDRQGRPVTPRMARLRRRCTHTWGLRGVTLDVGPGETVGLIGRNGAGKTTLLRLLAGVYTPDEGSVEVPGRVGPLLSVGAGLLPSLTGRENAVLLGVLAGLRRREARAAVESVAERSEAGDAFDRPVLSYSQGMKARLALAVLDHAEPDILLLDEVHEALDAQFRESLVERVHELAARGGIVVAAGHEVPELERLCDRAILLADGGVRADGPFAEVAEMHRPVAA